MKKFLALPVILLASVLGFAQAPVNVSQYSVNLSFLTGGPYGQSSAMDTTFADQFTTNSQLQGDFIVMPSAGYTGYFGGATYNLTQVCPLLAVTSLSCGKFMPFVTGEAGLGRIAQGSNPTTQGFAALVEVGAGYDPTGSGKYGLAFKGGYGDFGPTIAGLSNKGFVFYSGISFGGGTNAAATASKVQHLQEAARKKQAKMQLQACYASGTAHATCKQQAKKS